MTTRTHYSQPQIGHQDAEQERGVRNAALYYILHHLGDGVFVGDPVWMGDRWELPLKVKGRDGAFGQIVLSPEAEVLEALTTSDVELEEALRAPGTSRRPDR